MKTLKFLTIAFAFFLTSKNYAQRGGGSFTTVVNLTVTNEENFQDCSHEIALLVDYNFNGTAYTQISNTVSMGPSNQTVLLSLTIPFGSTITAKKVKFTKAGGNTIIADLSLLDWGGPSIYGWCANTVMLFQPTTINSTTLFYQLSYLFN